MTTVVSSQQDVLLDVQNLSVDYLSTTGVVHAVTDVSFKLHRGEILGIAGESGCGKSTLIYALTRLLRPPAVVTGGRVLYYPKRVGSLQTVATSQGSQSSNGSGEVLDILDLTSAQLRAVRWNQVSIVFQSAMNALNPVLTLGTQITDVLRTHRPTMSEAERKQQAAELLRQVGISPDRLRSYPHELSGGMRQRAIIAIALALRPELIIMDEPTTALDVVVQHEILQMISELCKDLNTSLIFITHDLSLLLELADNIAIMYAGRIIEQADCEELYDHPRHPYSYGLLNSFPSIHGPRKRLSGIPGSPPDLRAAPSGCAFHPRCPLAFEPCSRVLPVLSQVPTMKDGQLVACHLYDSNHYAEIPQQEVIAAQYAALAERSDV